jgi:WD40 repeat protein
VHSVGFSPDGKQVVSGSDDRTVKVWNAQTGQVTLTLKGHTYGVLSVAFSPDGKRIVSGNGDKTVKVWNAQTGQETLTLRGHTDDVWGVSFSPDGTRIVSGSEDKTVKVWDAQTGQETFTLKGHTEGVMSVAFSPDGTRIVSGSRDKTVKVWDNPVRQDTLIPKGISSLEGGEVAFSPDGKRILTGGFHGIATVWDTETGQELRSLKGFNGPITSVAFRADGKRILIGSGNVETKVWDGETGQEVLSLKGSSPVSRVAFTPDGKRILTGHPDGTAKVWDAELGQEIHSLKGHSADVSCVAVSSDSKRILTGSRDKTVKVWDAEKGQVIHTLKGHISQVISVTFSPDGKRIVTGGGGFDDPLRPLGGEVKVWEAETGQEILSLKGHTDGVTCVVFSPDGKRIVSCTKDIIHPHTKPGELKMWDAQTGHETLTLKGHNAGEACVAFSPDGKRILSVGLARRDLVLSPHVFGYYSLKVLDAHMDQVTLPLKGDTQTVTCLAFSSDGKRIASGSGDNTLKLWDVQTAREILTLKGASSGVSRVSFSPDGQRIFGWDPAGKVLAWFTHNGEPTDSTDPPPLPPAGPVRSPDGFLRAEPRGNTIAVIDTRQPQPETAVWPLPDAAERKRYHTEQARLAEQDKQWFAVAFHLGRLLLDAPDDVDLKQRREEALRKHNESTPGTARRSNLRYKAACAAAQAGAEQEPLDNAAKAQLRGQALELLKAELTWHRQQLESDKPADRVAVQGALLAWQKEPDLIGIRDAAALARLPADEQKVFAQLWADVATLLKEAEEKAK